MPMLAGPGAISTVILLDTQARTIPHQLILFVCLIAVGLASYITFAVAGRGAHWIGPIAEKIITRLMGLLLAPSRCNSIFNALDAENSDLVP